MGGCFGVKSLKDLLTLDDRAHEAVHEPDHGEDLADADLLAGLELVIDGLVATNILLEVPVPGTGPGAGGERYRANTGGLMANLRALTPATLFATDVLVVNSAILSMGKNGDAEDYLAFLAKASGVLPGPRAAGPGPFKPVAAPVDSDAHEADEERPRVQRGADELAEPVAAAGQGVERRHARRYTRRAAGGPGHGRPPGAPAFR